MEIVFIVLAVSTLLAFGYLFIWLKKSTKKEVEPLSSKKSEITYLPIQKVHRTNPVHLDQSDFVINIQSISRLLDHIEFVIELKNNSDRYIKIDFQKVTLIQGNGKIYNGDYSYLDFTMGTNDLILKNTVLSGMSLIRNIKFEEFDIQSIRSTDVIEVELFINEIKYKLSTNVNDSEVTEIKVVRIVDI